MGIIVGVEHIRPEISPSKIKAALGKTIAAVQNKEPFPDFVAELDHICKDGSSVCAEVRTSGIYDANGISERWPLCYSIWINSNR